MTLFTAIGKSLALLGRRDRRRLILATSAQVSTSFLDLLGVVLIGLVTAIAVSAISGSPAPISVASFLNRLHITSSEMITFTVWLAIGAGVVLIGKSALNVILTRRVLRFLAHRQAAVSGRLAEGLLSWPLLRVQKRSSHETAYALTEGVNFATLVILGSASIAVTEMSLLLVLSLGLLMVSPVVTIFSIVFFSFVAVAIHRMLSNWAGRLARRATTAEISSYSSVQEALSTYREVTVSNRRGLYVEAFQGLRWEAASVQSDLQFMNLIPKYTYEIALVLGAGILATTQLLTRDVSSAISIIAVFLVAGSRIVPSMLRLQGAALTIRHAQGMAIPTFELADEIAETSPHQDLGYRGSHSAIYTGTDVLEFRPDICVTNVSLTYPGVDTPAVHEVSFRVEPGEALALVGPTGAGKSTIADILLGVISPDSGSVRIGGVDPSEATRRWPGGIAYVPQQTVMVNGTVRQNVALGLPDANVDDELVWEALERAQLSDFLRAERDGLNTIIGENGILLSGGQKQRLGFARALYTRPKLLVLDEATSALDAQTEGAISRTLSDLSGEVTSVTIAHRLATIRNANTVLYIKDGHIAAAGSFSEVRAQSLEFDNQARLLGL